MVSVGFMGALVNIERIDFDKPISIYPSYVHNKIGTPIVKSLTILPNPNHINIFNNLIVGDKLSSNLDILWADINGNNRLSTCIELPEKDHDATYNFASKKMVSLMLSLFDGYFETPVNIQDTVNRWFLLGDVSRIYLDFYENKHSGIAFIYPLINAIIPDFCGKYKEQRKLLSALMICVFEGEYYYENDLIEKLLLIVDLLENAHIAEIVTRNYDIRAISAFKQYHALTEKNRVAVRQSVIDNIKNYLNNLPVVIP